MERGGGGLGQRVAACRPCEGSAKSNHIRGSDVTRKDAEEECFESSRPP